VFALSHVWGFEEYEDETVPWQDRPDADSTYQEIQRLLDGGLLNDSKWVTDLRLPVS
jgi:hypothetical protein